MLEAHARRRDVQPRKMALPQHDMRAVILAGGLGTRLRSLVSDRPKPMADIDGKPFLEYQIEFLKRYRIVHLVLCVGYLHEHIQQRFKDGTGLDVSIDYSIEDRPLGTAGALKHAQKRLEGSGTFLVLNGDSYFEVDLRRLIQFHERKKAEDRRCLGTIALAEMPDVSSYGSIQTDREGRILSFKEKPDESNGSIQINAGMYVLEPDMLNWIPGSIKVSLETETFPSVLEGGHHLFGYPAQGFFADIGTPDGYRRFRDYLEERRR